MLRVVCGSLNDPNVEGKVRGFICSLWSLQSMGAVSRTASSGCGLCPIEAVWVVAQQHIAKIGQRTSLEIVSPSTCLTVRNKPQGPKPDQDQ